MKTKFLIALIYIVNSVLVCTEGIICQTCSGRNELECRSNGFYEQCSVGKICSTSINRQGHTLHITRGCKQREACLNEQNQNWNQINDENRVCNRKSRVSICRCCCYADYCNRNERCTAATLDSERDVSSCPQLVQPFPNGRRRCSNSNMIGSVCNFRCSSNYQVNPRYSQKVTCLPNGKWDKPVPCCSKPCPPNIFLDLAIVRNLKDHDLLLRLLRTALSNFLSTLSAGPNSLRLAQLRHDSAVRTPYLGFRETANLTSEEILNLTITENLDDDTNASAVNTGAALWHLYRNEFNTEFDRPNARNVVILITEGDPQDDVATPARALRESGVTIYSFHLNTNQADEYNEKPFLEISGFRDFRRILVPGVDFLDDLFFDDLCSGLCNI